MGPRTTPVVEIFERMAPVVGSDVDTDRIRSRFDEVLRRRAFDYAESPLRRLLNWLGEQVQRLLERLHVPVASAPGGTGAGSYVVLIVLIVLVIALVVVIVRRLRARRARTRDRVEEPRSVLRIRGNDDSRGWMDEYLEADGVGSVKMAVLAGYRGLVASLTGRGLLDGSMGDSPREIVDEVAGKVPGARLLMEEATDVFEGPWYADEVAAAEDPDRLAEITDRITGMGRS